MCGSCSNGCGCDYLLVLQKNKFNGGFKSSSSLASVATGAAGRSIQAEARLETPLSQTGF